MTFSNGSFNPNPLANPFNTLLGPANYTLNPRGIARKAVQFNPNRTDLPLLQPYDPTQHQELHVPQAQTPPLSMKSMQNIIDDYARQKTWDDREIYKLSSPQDSTGQLQDKKSQEYWKHVDEESKKLSASMSDEQKKMLADLDSGKLFPMSKLEDIDD